MSDFKVNPQVRPERKVKQFDGVAQGTGGLSGSSSGLVGLYATADLPAASDLPNGCLAFDTTVTGLKITISGSWVLAN